MADNINWNLSVSFNLYYFSPTQCQIIFILHIIYIYFYTQSLWTLYCRFSMIFECVFRKRCSFSADTATVRACILSVSVLLIDWMTDQQGNGWDIAVIAKHLCSVWLYVLWLRRRRTDLMPFSAKVTVKVSIYLSGTLMWWLSWWPWARNCGIPSYLSCLWSVDSATPDLRLPSQTQGITAHWLVPNYTGDRGTCVGITWTVELNEGAATEGCFCLPSSSLECVLFSSLVPVCLCPVIMPPPHSVEALSDAFVWRLSVCHVHRA